MLFVSPTLVVAHFVNDVRAVCFTVGRNQGQKRVSQTMFSVIVFAVILILIQVAVPYMYCSCLYDTGKQMEKESLLIRCCILNRSCLPFDSDCKLKQTDNRVDVLSLFRCKFHPNLHHGNPPPPDTTLKSYNNYASHL